MSPQRFRKFPFSSVHAYARRQRLQKVPLWRAFSKSSIFIDRFHRGTRVDGSPIRKEKVAFSNQNGCGQGLRLLVRHVSRSTSDPTDDLSLI